MRIATHRDDPGYSAEHRNYIVTFNGKEIPHRLLISADEASGILVTKKARANGELVTVTCADGVADPVTVIESGEVAIYEVGKLPVEVQFG